MTLYTAYTKIIQPRSSFLCVIDNKSLRLISVFVICFTLSHCSSLDLPTVKESEEKIQLLKPRIAALDTNINSIGEKLIVQHDIVMRTKMSVFNSILAALANNRSDDVKIVFNGNKPWMQEEKNLLGIKYTNSLNIDGGEINVNLTDFHFNSFEENKLSGEIHLQGNGKISISGKYLAIPASVTPDVEMKLDENIEFSLMSTDSGFIVLKPVPKMMHLQIKFFIKLLEWKIPWNQSQSFQLDQIIKPILIPTNINSSIQFPTLAQAPKEKYSFITKPISIHDVIVTASQNVLEWRSNISFRK